MRLAARPGTRFGAGGHPGRLRRKLVVMGGVAAVALGAEGWFAWTHRLAGRSVDMGSDMAMVLAVRDRILAAGLTHAPKDCLAFVFHEPAPGQPTLLGVYQKHNETCPGGPAQAPRLFGVRVDRANGRMWDDAGQAGMFVPFPG